MSVTGNPDPSFNKVTSSSPKWSSNTKTVVALTMVAIIAGLLIRFRQLVVPLFVAIILAYLIYPLANFLHKRVGISWRLSALTILILMLVTLLGLLTLGGFAIVEQVQSLIHFIQDQIRAIPTIIAELSAHPIDLGFFQIDLATYDLTSLVNQLLGMIQPILSNTANILGRVAAGAATTIGWIFFALLVSYFILNDSGGVRARLINLQIPGYNEDLTRMGFELGRIWNAFLRGQLIIITLTILIYIFLLGAMGVRFYFGLAILAGLARFVPYIGPWVTWITYGLVTYFQGSTILGMETWFYVVFVLAVAIVVDFTLDNFAVPRLMGDALDVHPASIMVAALISASLFGLVGILLAAPVMATIKLIVNYLTRKLFDLDPWAKIEKVADREPAPLVKNIETTVNRTFEWVRRRINRRWPEGVPVFIWVEGFFNGVKRSSTSNRYVRKPEENPTVETTITPEPETGGAKNE
ncbi:MAG: AI-2E family transporter [Peptococcaceae bacterium]|nr:AI-2E family transporter [Peptococcaceae bacterium]